LNFIFEDKLKKITHVGFEVLAAVIRERMFFWLVTLCGLEKAQCFEGTYHFHLQGQRVRQVRSRIYAVSKFELSA
jgi:hypothetical protein